MKYGIFLLMSLVLLPASATEPPKPPVTVEYISPEKFTDISSTNHGPPNSSYLDQLSKHLSKKAASYLAPGERLTIAIKDIDMAGGFEPWVMPVNPDVRMVRDIYPPRIALSYELRDAHGQVLKAGDAKLSNPAFLLNPRPNSIDTMRHEKALLDNWLRKSFAERNAKSLE
ncbi:DUF3016 domain-containing protein [Methylobacillus arboreus]|uniref:DUF3016 domain-containing protein n=1 Tax=Methylobacillus arboreus TaxID=755170 RepID=UPI001E2AD605|nr:DUF3016 domain-containing protein [Methylobacillus arboreus]MCB5189456.1 DUF3016 domain-containing protein [Methylobacillus arboreus]